LLVVFVTSAKHGVMFWMYESEVTSAL